MPIDLDKPVGPLYRPLPPGTPAARKSPARTALAAARAAASALAGVPHADKGAQALVMEPELAADLVARALGTPANPSHGPAEAVRARLAYLTEAAEAAGLPRAFARALVDRLARNPEFISSGIALTNAELIAVIDDKIRLAVAHLDPVVFAAMSGRDLAVTFGILLDKKRLLQGEPTQILDDARRRTLDELLPHVLKEAERRGLAVQTHNLVEVNPARP